MSLRLATLGVFLIVVLVQLPMLLNWTRLQIERYESYCSVRVFVYNFSAVQQKYENYTFPKYANNITLYDVDQHELGKFILMKLLGSECVTKDPNQADMFIVPMFVPDDRSATPEEMEKGGVLVATYPDQTKDTLKVVCPVLNDVMNLPHFQKAIHVVVADRYFAIRNFCHEFVTINPVVDKGTVWVTNSVHVNGDDQVSMALPSSVIINDVREELPWLHEPRPYFVSLVGSTEGSPSHKILRKKLFTLCEAHPLCHAVRFPQHAAGSLVRAYETKHQSTFCLEPGGYGPDRKSISDSLHLGCIPVITSFEYFDRKYKLWDANWKWIENSSVYVSEDDIVREKIDIFDVLSSIPEKK